jgi:hypothetical protein
MIYSETTYTIKCDSCYEILAQGKDLATVIDGATERCVLRYDYGRGLKAWECYNCKAKREFKVPR